MIAGLSEAGFQPLIDTYQDICQNLYNQIRVRTTISTLRHEIYRALELLSKIPGSTMGVQLERLRLGTTSTARQPSSVEDAAIYRVDSTCLSVLRGLSDGQALAIYLRYYWRPGYRTVERKETGRRGGIVVTDAREPIEPRADQCAQAMGVTMSEYVDVLKSAHAVCRDNLKTTHTTWTGDEEWQCSTKRRQPTRGTQSA